MFWRRDTNAVRKVTVYAGRGVLLCVLASAILGVAVLGCSGGSNSSNKPASVTVDLRHSYQKVHGKRKELVVVGASLAARLDVQSDKDVVHDNERITDGIMVILYELCYRPENFTDADKDEYFRQVRGFVDQQRSNADEDYFHGQHPELVKDYRRARNELLDEMDQCLKVAGR